MTQNTFFYNCSNINLSLKYFLTKELYSKFLAREKFEVVQPQISKNRVILIDMDGEVFIKKLSRIKLGYSIFLKKFILSHVKFKKLRIQSFLFYEKSIKLTRLSLSLLNTLSLVRRDQKPNKIFVLKGHKNGYLVFGKGVKGKLPNYHFIKPVTNNFCRIFDLFMNYYLSNKRKSCLGQFLKLELTPFMFNTGPYIIQKIKFREFWKKGAPLNFNNKQTFFIRRKPAKRSHTFNILFLSPFIPEKKKIFRRRKKKNKPRFKKVNRFN